MKANRAESHYEPCHRSLDDLKCRVEQYFKNKGLPRPWLPEHQSWDEFQASELADQVQDIVLFGSFLRSILESGLWPFPKVRIWCLSSSVREYLESQFFENQVKIGLIPRDELYPSQVKNYTEKPEASKKFEFVYAGRLSASKNIPLLIELYSQFDQDPNVEASLTLYGEFDDELSDNYGRRVQAKNFETRLKEQMASKNWNRPPVLKGVVSQDQWSLESRDKILISLSDYYAEDFGVSIAQAQSLGTSVIVSDWGGHRDVQNAFGKISATHLAFGLEDRHLLEQKAVLIKKEILEKKRIQVMSSLGCDSPTMIHSQELSHFRLSFCQRSGLGLIWASRVGLSYYADQDEGAIFFQRYNDIMAGAPISFETLFIFKEIDKKELSEEELSSFYKVFKEIDVLSFHALSERYIFKKDQLELCQRAQRIVVCSGNQKVKQVLNELFPGKVM